MANEIPELNPDIVKALQESATSDGLGDNTVRHLTLGSEFAVVYNAPELKDAMDVVESGHLQEVWDVVEDLQKKGMPNEEIKKFLHSVADGIEDN